MFLGHTEDGFAGLETALRLSPRDPNVPLWQFYMCHSAWNDTTPTSVTAKRVCVTLFRLLPTAANLVKFGRKGQRFANAGSPVFICRTRKRQARFRSRSKNMRNGFDGLSRCDARRWRATEIPAFSVENVSKAFANRKSCA
jgi:hypothetical protein